MAVYRIYPEADTFITSFKSESNAGLDEIVELSSFPNQILKGESSRILVKFNSFLSYFVPNEIVYCAESSKLQHQNIALNIENLK